MSISTVGRTMFDKVRAFFQHLEFIFPGLVRLYLVPVFFLPGITKANSFADTAAWFGNTEWGLGLPFPEVQASLAIGAEVGGAVLLSLGLATRLAVIPMMCVMMMAAVTVHLKNGWQVVHDTMSPYASTVTPEAIDRLSRAKSILKEHGNYDWLTEHGNLVALNNGVEWVATYFLLLLALFFVGGGRYISLDYWICRKWGSKSQAL